MENNFSYDDNKKFHGNRKLILIYTSLVHVFMPVVILSSHLHLSLSNSLLPTCLMV